MKKLPKLSEYVNYHTNLKNCDYKLSGMDILKLIMDYTCFITQPLNLSHFVPAVFRDGVWEVLETPESLKGYYETDKEGMKQEFILREEYQTALENVVFKNVSLPDADYYLWTHKNIEDLITCELQINDKIAEKFKI